MPPQRLQGSAALSSQKLSACNISLSCCAPSFGSPRFRFLSKESSQAPEPYFNCLRKVQWTERHGGNNPPGEQVSDPDEGRIGRYRSALAKVGFRIKIPVSPSRSCCRSPLRDPQPHPDPRTSNSCGPEPRHAANTCRHCCPSRRTRHRRHASAVSDARPDAGPAVRPVTHECYLCGRLERSALRAGRILTPDPWEGRCRAPGALWVYLLNRSELRKPERSRALAAFRSGAVSLLVENKRAGEVSHFFPWASLRSAVAASSLSASLRPLTRRAQDARA